MNTEVVIEVADGVEVTAVIANTSAERLALKVGMKAYAVVRASDVIVGTDRAVASLSQSPSGKM